MGCSSRSLPTQSSRRWGLGFCGGTSGRSAGARLGLCLLGSVGWSAEEFSRRTGLEPLFRTREQADAIEASSYLHVHPDYLEFPVFHTASAGESDASPIEGGVAFIPRSKLIEKGVDPRHVIVYRINGD